MTDFDAHPRPENLLPGSAFSGWSVVITGAGRGIGAACAHLLAKLGARVVVAEISPEGAQVAQQIRENGGEALYCQTDISDPEAVNRLAAFTHDHYAPPSLLINNAILSPTASVLEMDVALWDRVMAVNLRGTFLTCQAFLPGMLNAGRGAIINMISSEALPYMSAYMASKQGIAAFSRSLAGEVGEQGIKVVAFAPGFVDTPGLRSAGRGLAPHMGLDEEAFMSLSFHPAYARAMPAADAALATALLAYYYLEDYHGDQSDGYMILERAGVIQPSAQPQATQLTTFAAAPFARQALEAARELHTVLAETDAEFGRLPVLVRPLARQGFKSKAGQSLPEWLKAIARMIDQLAASQTISPASLPDFSGLIRYFREVPAETARFTRDPAVLDEITTLSQQRVAIIMRLAQALGADLEIKGAV